MDKLTIEVLGYVAGTFTVISLVPQLVKILKNKNCKDVSLMSYYMYIFVQTLWIIYGVGRGDLQIIISNAVCTVLSIMIIGFSNYYKNKTAVDNFIGA